LSLNSTIARNQILLTKLFMIVFKNLVSFPFLGAPILTFGRKTPKGTLETFILNFDRLTVRGLCAIAIQAANKVGSAKQAKNGTICFFLF